MVDVSHPAAANLLEQAQHLRRELQRKDMPLALTYATATFAAVMILVGVAIEVANFSFALRQFLPVLSSGDPYAAIFPVLKLALGAAVIMVHVLLRQAGARYGDAFNRNLDIIGVLATILLVVGAMLFMAGSVNQGDGDGATSTGSLLSAPWALSLLLMALFPISILSNHTMLGWLSTCLTKIETVQENRRRARSIAEQIASIEQARHAIRASSDHVDALTGNNDTLDWDIATELAAVPGNLAAEINDHITVREIIDDSDGDVSAHDSLPELFREMPLTKMRALRDYLTGFSVETISSTIRAREA